MGRGALPRWLTAVGRPAPRWKVGRKYRRGCGQQRHGHHQKKQGWGSTAGGRQLRHGLRRPDIEWGALMPVGDTARGNRSHMCRITKIGHGSAGGVVGDTRERLARENRHRKSSRQRVWGRLWQVWWHVLLWRVGEGTAAWLACGGRSACACAKYGHLSSWGGCRGHAVSGRRVGVRWPEPTSQAS